MTQAFDIIIVGAGMVRDVHTSTLDLCKRLIGPTHTSLAQNKARLIFSTLDTSLEVGPSPYPTSTHSLEVLRGPWKRPT